MRYAPLLMALLVSAGCRAPETVEPSGEAPATEPAAAVAPGEGTGTPAGLLIERAPVSMDPDIAIVGTWAFDEEGTRAASESPWLQALPPGAEGTWAFDALSEGSGAFAESWTFGPDLPPLADAAGTWEIVAADRADGTLDFVARKEVPEMPDVTETISARARFDGDDTIIVTTVGAPEVPSVWRRAPVEGTP